MSEENFDCLLLDRQLCFPLYAASRKVIRQYTEPLEKLGLTYTQYVVMMVLWEEKSVSVKDLGKRLFLDSGTLTPLLKALEKKGYVLRRRSKEDERIVLVSPTETGMELRREARAIPASVAACVRLPKEDAAKLYDLLQKLLATFEDQ